MTRGVGRSATNAALAFACVAFALPLVGLLSGSLRVVPVLSGSMEPAIDAGAAAILTPEPLSEVRPGQVIAYRIPVGDHHLEVHRVTSVLEAGTSPVVETKGDANDAADPWLARLHGERVWTVRSQVPYLGYVLLFLGRPVVRVACWFLVIGVVIAIGLRRIWRPRPEATGVATPS
jgi:signal peptidase